MRAGRARGGIDPLSLLKSKISMAPRALAVALSGGRDSVALLLACVHLRDSGVLGDRTLRAIHIDHGLQSDSPIWARKCRALAREFSIPFSLKRVVVSAGRGQSLEALAREQRYLAFGALVRRDEWLLTAHHLDDQAETVLLQLLRGAGVRGLAAMPESMPLGRGVLVRPWLAVPRSQIESWLDRTGRSWIEDPSNQDLRFDRNYLRQVVMPALTARWPSAARVIARSAGHLAEAQALINEYVEGDLGAMQPPRSASATRSVSLTSAHPGRGSVIVDRTSERTLDWQALRQYGVARQRHILRAWLSAAGVTLPDAVHLERIRCELPAARPDAQPVVRWVGGEVRRYGSLLYALTPACIPAPTSASTTPSSTAGNPPAPRRVRSTPGDERLWKWRVGERLLLGEGRGSLRLELDPHGPLNRRALPKQLWIRERSGGESIALQAGGGRRRVKALLREARVLPWWREHVPLIGVGDDVVAVADLFIAAPYRATGDEAARDRLRLIWEWEHSS